ncbi:MAG: hypothetical protein J6J16_00185 [Lachnospiraceae bacterium]|nr:hypothetical protein [Lachnospiraceae bacterium]
MLKNLKKVLAGLLTVIMVVCLLPENIMISHGQEETIHTLTEQIVINSSNLSTYDNTTITGTCVFSDDDDLSSRPGITIDGVEVHLTIRDLNIETKFFNDNDPAPIALRNGATLYLTVEGVNICDVNRSNAAGISVPKGCTLIITDASSGTLKAFGGNYYGGGAGIGAPGNGYYVANGIDTSSTTTTYTCGTIIINGGTIQARGGTHKVNGTPMLGAAGIGNSSPGHYTNEDDVDFNNMGTGIIEINGGNVEASGGAGAAGIGGGDCNSVESISINGGTINATPGSGGASIGMGSWLKDGSYTYNTVISINGGNVTANGNIGYGSYNINESKGNGTLSGGSVNIEDEAELNISGAIRPNTSNCKGYTVNVSLNDKVLNEEKNITAMVEVDGITRTAEYTLTPTNYNVSFGMNCYMNDTNIGKNAKITISDGTNTWSKEFILAQDNNLEIGKKMYPVTLKVSSPNLTQNLSENDYILTITDSEGNPVSNDYVVMEPGLNFDGTIGRIRFFVANGEYRVSFQTDSLNNGESVSKELTVDNQATEVDLHLDIITIDYNLDLYYGNIEIGYKANGGYVKYSDSEGEHTDSYLSPNTLFNINQSNNDDTTANTVAIKSWDSETPVNINIDSINISTDEKVNIDIGQNIQVNLTLKGESKLACDNEDYTYYSVVKVRTNSILNINGTSADKLSMYNDQSSGCIELSDSTVNIMSGNIEATSNGRAATIGSNEGSHVTFNSAKATINIYGGTVKASNAYLGAAIGSGQFADALVNISGGTIKASNTVDGLVDGAAIGNGYGGNATLYITGGNINSNKTVTATNGEANGSKTLVCKELTIQGVDNDIPITDADNIPEYYGLNDVKTIDGKLYLYLPEDATLPKNILSGEDNYIQHMTEDTKYISHEHILGYTINGTSITENCAGSDVCGTAPSTITLSDPDANGALVYNGAAYEAETTGTLSSGATASVEYTSLTGGVSLVDGKAVNAGDYRATMYLIDTEGDKIKDGNNNPISVSVEFTIEKATLTVTSYTAEDRAFDGTDDIQVTEATLSGALGNDIVTIQLPVTATLVDEQGEPLIGGVADVTDNGYSKVLLPTLALTGDDKNNYILEQPSGAVSLSSNVMIKKAEAPMLPEEKKTYTYGQTPTVERYSISLPEDCGDISYSFEEDDSDNIISNIVVSDEGVLTYDVEKVDEYTDEITATVTVTAVMDNYKDATFTSSITITDKKIQTLNAEDISMTYGDEGKTISLSGNQTQVSYKVVENPEQDKTVVTVDANGKVSIVNAGTAIIEIKAASNDIYAEATCQIKVTVAPKPAYITAKSYIIAEKDELPSVYEYDVEGLVSGEKLSQDMKDSIKAATGVSDSNKTGDYEITITGPTLSGNYSLSYASGKLAILPADEAPFIMGDDGKMGWDAISDEIDDAKAGDEVVVDMNGATVVPGDILEDVRDKDITISFKFDNGLIWTIDGGTITDGDIGNIDFGTTIESEDNPLNNIPVDVINNITGEKSTIEVNLAYSGEFGFTAVLTTNLSSANAGYYANLFYYNPTTKELEYVCADVIAGDGTAELTFTHASDYVIVIDDVDLGNVKEATTPDSNANTGDATPLMALAFMLMLSGTLLVAMSRKKKEI